MISPTELRRIVPTISNENLEKYHDPLLDAMREFEVDSPPRVAAFIAQVAHESGGFRYVRELADGAAYDARVDLGNTQAEAIAAAKAAGTSPGRFYRGRGLIQITGYYNYRACGGDLGIDCVAHPELLEAAVAACRSAGWFWSRRKLNQFADKGDFLTVTKRINGGTNGWKDRVGYYERAKEVLCLA